MQPTRPRWILAPGAAAVEALLVLLALGGCARPARPDRGARIARLLERLEVEQPPGDAGAIRRVARIEPARALREGRLRPRRGVDSIRAAGGDAVAFTTTKRRAEIEIDVQVEAADANMIAVTLDGGSARLVQGHVRWVREGQKEDAVRGRGALLVPPLGLDPAPSLPGDGAASQGWTTLYAAVGDDPQWTGSITRLLLEPTLHPGIDIRIRGVDLLAVPYLLERKMLEGMGPVGPFAIAGETRRGVYAAPPFRASARVLVPRRGILELGFGIAERDWRMPGDGVLFRVSIKEGTGESGTTLMERYLDPKHRPGDRGWKDERIYLPAYAGKSVRLVFETRGSVEGKPDERCDSAVLADPVLYSPGLEPGERNVVLVSMDTTRADRLGLYGNPRPATPNLDRLSRGAVLFESTTSQAPRTLDSHMSLFTSLYPSTHDVLNATSRLNPGFRTLAELLGDAGYHTAAFTEGGFLSARYGFQRGFDRYREGRIRPGAGGDVARTFDAATAWLRRNHEKKFLLFVHTYEAHVPYCPPPPYRDLFAGEYAGPLAGRCVTRRVVEGYNARGERPAPEDRAYMVARYDEELRCLDAHVGRLLRTLGDLGLRERTLVVLFADHGEEFQEHLLFGKHAHAIWEPIVHVPLLVALPGRHVPGARVREPVSLVDVAPTILDALGLPIPAQFQGRSLLDRITGGGALPPQPVYSENHGFVVRASIRERRYKFIRTYEVTEGKEKALSFYSGQSRRLTPMGDRELYDLGGDPGERTNLVERLPGLADRLDRALGAFRDEARRRSRPAVVAGADPETIERLRALGYLHDEDTPDTGGEERKR